MRHIGGGSCSATLTCVGQLLFAGVIHAEPTARDAEPSGIPFDEITLDVDSGDAPVDEIVVTGTRLWINTAAPVTVLDRRDIERGGANSLGDVLQALPQNAGSSLNTNVNTAAEPLVADSSGDRSVRVALRGHSTLVLLNGRRFPNSGLGVDSSVDLNTLPVSFVDRIEVLPSGASAMYGSDAVGGVINVITRREVAGFSLAGSQKLTEHGDASITTGQAAAGLDLFGGTWLVGVDYVRQDGVKLDRRSYSAEPLLILDGDGTLGFGGNWGTLEGRFVVPAGNALGLAPGVYTRVEGTVGQTAADYRLFDRAVDGFNFAPYNYSQTPNERGALWLIGSYPLSERTNLFVEGLVHHRESALDMAPDPYFGGSLPTLADGSEGIPANNHYNPFGVDLPRSGLSTVARRFVELGDRGSSEDVDLWRALIGLEGKAADWAWTLSVANAESDALTVETGGFFRARLVPAVGPSGPDASGRIVCGPPDPATGLVPAASIIPGCVPFNLFGGPGSITGEQRNYISAGRLRHTGTNEEQTAQLILSGPWGQLSGGELQWVLGADYRRESGSYVLDAQYVLETGESSLTGGTYEARELFAEVQLPLLRDRPWAQDLKLNVGLRWSDFSSFDNHLSWQAGLHWQPLEEWTLRANYSDVFRAPELWSLHAPRIRIEGFDIDPCGNSPTPRLQANCAANGVPGGAYVQGGEEFEIRAGGNPDLEPETGYSVGAGLLYTPGWVEGLSASIDFFHLEISNLIRQLFVDQVLFECAERGLPQVCDDIERFPDGSIKQVSTFDENFGGGYDTRGVDFAVEWNAATAFGEVDAALLATYLERWDEQPFLEGTVFKYAGKFDAGAMPHWRGLGTVDLASGRWLAGYSAEYIGSYSQLVESTPFGSDFEPFTRQIEGIVYHDIEGRYEFENGITVRAAITNLTNEDPPFVNLASAANTDPGTYRLLGRTYFLELRYAFTGRRQ